MFAVGVTTKLQEGTTTNEPYVILKKNNNQYERSRRLLSLYNSRSTVRVVRLSQSFDCPSPSTAAVVRLTHPPPEAPIPRQGNERSSFQKAKPRRYLLAYAELWLSGNGPEDSSAPFLYRSPVRAAFFRRPDGTVPAGVYQSVSPLTGL